MYRSMGFAASEIFSIVNENLPDLFSNRFEKIRPIRIRVFVLVKSRPNELQRINLPLDLFFVYDRLLFNTIYVVEKQRSLFWRAH